MSQSVAVVWVIETFNPLAPGHLITAAHLGDIGATAYIIIYLSVHSATNSAPPPSLLGLCPYSSSFGTAFVPVGQLGHRYLQLSSTRTRMLGSP
jgi:hypothetical protein